MVRAIPCDSDLFHSDEVKRWTYSEKIPINESVSNWVTKVAREDGLAYKSVESIRQSQSRQVTAPIYANHTDGQEMAFLREYLAQVPSMVGRRQTTTLSFPPSSKTT